LSSMLVNLYVNIVWYIGQQCSVDLHSAFDTFLRGHHFAAKTAMQDLMLHHIVDYAELSCGQGAWQ